MVTLSEALFGYLYRFIFIYLGTLLEANMNKSLDFRVLIYYFLCFLFLLAVVVILIVGCIFTTPTNSDNQPYESRIGLLGKFILQIQFSSLIIELIRTVLLFIPTFYSSTGLSIKGSVYPVLVVGQRFIESEYLASRNSSEKDSIYYYKKILFCFYIDLALHKPVTSKDVELRETIKSRETQSSVNRITIVQDQDNPLNMTRNSEKSPVSRITTVDASRIRTV